MNPELPSPQAAPERSMPQYEQGNEYLGQLANPELAGERSPEREQNMQSIDRQPAPQVPIVVPMPPAVVPMPAPVVDDSATNPVVAGDDDLIEKEWVDKAKKIIAETKDDPYRREQEVNRLQADYLYKRYGRVIGASE